MIKMEYEEFIKAIKKQRIEKGISQQRLASALGLTRQQICNIENGRSDMKMTTYLGLCKILDVAPESLLSSPQLDTERTLLIKQIENLPERKFRLIEDLLLLINATPQDL